MRYAITSDEAYPVFYLAPEDEFGSFYPVAEVPDEFADRFHLALGEWNAVQIELRRMSDEARALRRGAR